MSSATTLIAEQVRRRVPGWLEDNVHGFLFVFGDPQAQEPGRQIICDGLTGQPIITAYVHGMETVIRLPHVSDSHDLALVLDILAATGALDKIGK